MALESNNELYKRIYVESKKFLIDVIDSEYSVALRLAKIEAQELLNHQIISNDKKNADSLNGIFQRMVESLQNRSRLPNVIGKQLSLNENGITINGIKALKYVLCDFDPNEIYKKYNGCDYISLLKSINNNNPKILNDKVRLSFEENSRDLWTSFSKHILSAARFFAKFKDAEEFKVWADKFYNDSDLRPALPMVLSNEIQGIGFALACDFLKELGYTKFGKPDVHIKEILTGIGVFGKVDQNLFFENQSYSSKNIPTDYFCHKYLDDIANNNGIEPFEIDKLLWLIGSGKIFFEHNILEDDSRSTQKQWKSKFIEMFNNNKIIK